MAREDDLSVGEAAKLLGVAYWQMDRAITRGLVPEPRQFGRYRVIRRADLPKIRGALEAAGYLQGKVTE